MTRTPTLPAGWNEKDVLDAALTIMATKLGRPCGFRALLAPGTSSVEVVFRPPADANGAGYICAGASYGPAPGESHERHNDLADGGYTRQTLDAVIEDLRREFEFGSTGT